MNDNLPPLPELSPPEVEEWSETFITLRGEGWKKETVEKYATDYARAAIEKDRAERQCVPAGYVRVPIEPTDEMLGAFFNACPMLGGGDDWEAATEGARQEVSREWAAPWAAMIAAAPRPQPVQQEPVGWIDAKALEELRLPEMTWMPIWNRQSGNRPVALYTSPLAAAPHPEPGPMAATVEEATRDVQKCLNERNGHGLDLRHVAMLVHHVQQAQGETK